MLRTIVIIFLVIISSYPVLAQNKGKEFKISLQTDLVAYTTPGGWSAWGVAQYQKNQLSVGYINYPNRDKSYYYNTGIKEDDRFIRVTASRYLKHQSFLKYFFYGANFEYHWRLLEETVTRELVKDTHIKIGPFIGSNWYPWAKKENFLKSFSVMTWASPVFIAGGENQDKAFETTGNIYDNQKTFNISFGVNISYTIFEK